MKKILLAGPGTGKTTKVKKDFLGSVKNLNEVLVLSFTNATINDLLKSFAKSGIAIDERNCMTLHSYALKVNHLRDLHILNTHEERVLKKYAEILGVGFTQFCEMLSSITYDQMILSLIEFAKTNPAYLKEKIGHIELLIVDEFQDFNEFEQILVHLIAEYADQTLILGDDDQCIYDFKDAKSDGIVALYNDAAVENIGHENKCYRCPDIVIEKSKNLLANNKNRVPKDWHPTGIPGDLKFTQTLTNAETISSIVEKATAYKKENADASILVLSPVKFAIEGLPEALEAAGFQVVNFFSNPIDIQIYQKIWKLRLVFSSHKLLNLILTVDCAPLSDYKKQKFRKMLKKHLADSFSFSKIRADAIEFLEADIIGYLETPPDFDSLLEQKPWNELKEMLSKVAGNTPGEKLNKIDRYANPPTVYDPKAVNIMSIHKSKGLEAEHVFIVGLVDGILPRTADGIEGIEAQRRLLFVGMTRAKKSLMLHSSVKWDGKHVHQLGKDKFQPVHSRGRLFQGRTSPFIAELKL